MSKIEIDLMHLLDMHKIRWHSWH